MNEPMNQAPGQTQSRQPGYEHEMHPEPDYMPRYASSERLRGKVAIVTGGDSGIGRAVAILFAREGADVCIAYKDETEDAAKTESLVEEEGARCICVSGDAGYPSFAENVVERCMQEFGRIDILVNNAAEQHAAGELSDISEDQLERTYRTNLYAHFFMTQAALPHLESGAAIICTTSVTAYRGQDLLIDYATTKGAIVTFVRAMASKLADRGIRVNGVAPGPIWTPLIPASFPEDKVKSFGQNTALGRPGQPNEVAPSYLFLACDDASYISGQILHPNGGEPVSS